MLEPLLGERGSFNIRYFDPEVFHGKSPILISMDGLRTEVSQTFIITQLRLISSLFAGTLPHVKTLVLNVDNRSGFLFVLLRGTFCFFVFEIVFCSVLISNLTKI